MACFRRFPLDARVFPFQARDLPPSAFGAGFAAFRSCGDIPSSIPRPATDFSAMTRPDFNTFFHALRTESLRTMPPGAAVFLSAGCSGRWYFDWIAENYPGIVSHVGVEAYSPKPDDLPANAHWIANTVSNMNGVADAAVDLVFSGQNIEHLAPADIVGFLCEAKRVLKPGGWLVMDSPNRLITERLGWVQPEHVVELCVDEIVELCGLAGFEIASVKGLWQCYDPVAHQMLAREPEEVESRNAHRASAAADDPENAFAWWIVARNSERLESRRDDLSKRVNAISALAFSRVASRFQTQCGTITTAPLNFRATCSAGRAGYVVYGPYLVAFRGAYRAWFRLRLLDPGRPRKSEPGEIFAKLDAVCMRGGTLGNVLAERSLSLGDFADCGADGFSSFSLDIAVDDAIFGVEFRVYSEGHEAFEVALPIEFVPR